MKEVLIIAFLFTGQMALAQEWTTHTAAVKFKIRNAGFAVNGTFDSVALYLTRSRLNWKDAALRGQVFAGSIDTGLGLRDSHLRKKEYLEVETYPWIRMESIVLKHTGKGKLKGIFRLAIKEHTREIPLVLNFTESEDRISLETEFELDRREFGLGGKSLILADEVRVFVIAEFRNSQ